MAFTIENAKELYLLDTKVENIFISEFMTAAPSDYVKVYLLSLMHASADVDTSNAEIAKQLSLEEEDVLKAWNYWESLNVVRKKHRDTGNKFSYDVEFLSIKEHLYGKKAKKDTKKENSLPKLIDDTELRNLYRSIERTTGRLLGGKEPTEIVAWIADYGVSAEMIIYAYSYCVKHKKKDNHKYVETILKEWVSKELKEIPEIESYLQEVDERHFLQKRVLKAMGFARNATEEEKRIMNTWFDDMQLSIDKVLDACSKTSGISNPNFNYVNQVLINRFTNNKNVVQLNTTNVANSNKTVSIAQVLKYYDSVRKEAEDEASKRSAEIYSKIKEIKEIDEELRLSGMEMSRIMISGSSDRKQQVAKYKDKLDELSQKKVRILEENGYDANYLETRYKCMVCKDSGIDDNNERCSCFREMQKEAELWQNS